MCAGRQGDDDDDDDDEEPSASATVRGVLWLGLWVEKGDLGMTLRRLACCPPVAVGPRPHATRLMVAKVARPSLYKRKLRSALARRRRARGQKSYTAT